MSNATNGNGLSEKAALWVSIVRARISELEAEVDSILNDARGPLAAVLDRDALAAVSSGLHEANEAAGGLHVKAAGLELPDLIAAANAES